MSTTPVTIGQRVRFEHRGNRYGFVVDINTLAGVATIVFGTSADDPEAVEFPYPVRLDALTPVDGRGEPVQAEPVELARFTISGEPFDLVVLHFPASTSGYPFELAEQAADGGRRTLASFPTAAPAMAAAINRAGWDDGAWTTVTPEARRPFERWTEPVRTPDLDDARWYQAVEEEASYVLGCGAILTELATTERWAELLASGAQPAQAVARVLRDIEDDDSPVLDDQGAEIVEGDVVEVFNPYANRWEGRATVKGFDRTPGCPRVFVNFHGSITDADPEPRHVHKVDARQVPPAGGDGRI